MGFRLMRPYSIPKEEIKIASKSGFLTKDLWKKYLNHRCRSWAFETWKRYIEKGIFKPYGRFNNGEVVVPNKDSPIVKELVGSDISPPPFAYQLRHDELTLDFVLKLLKQDKITDYYFEPEIRKQPEIFELNSHDKIPDAIVYSKDSRYAIEVEMTRKNPKRYRQALESYASIRSFDEVYYLTNGVKIKNQILKIAKDIQYPSHRCPIRLSLLDAG
ncbi:MAG: hypothetical protein KDD45_13025 [Bdellovibrionales bacterium]|nr:hypothetical protein [Bdellovibrionales bacterium]